MTDAHLLTLEAIRAYRAEHGYSPSIRELCELRELTSTATVHAQLKVLMRRGLITWNRAIPRSYRPTDESAPLAAVTNLLREIELTPSDAAFSLS